MAQRKFFVGKAAVGTTCTHRKFEGLICGGASFTNFRGDVGWAHGGRC
jgi:hypothetical protein